MKLNEYNNQLLEHTYLQLFPEEIPSSLLNDYKSILELEGLLKHAQPSKKVLNHLLNIICKKIENNQRFRKATFIKLIRAHIKDEFLDDKILDKLFFVFKWYINNLDEELQWKVATFLKDRELKDDQIYWLIDHWESSIHFLNRLLRYPKANEIISKWALDNIYNEDLIDRKSELIARILNFDTGYTDEDKVSFVWGIYHSKLDINKKEMLLVKSITNDTFEHIIEIAFRLELTDLIKNLYNKNK